MDANVRSWIAEFLLLNSNINPNLVMELIDGDTVNSRIKKIILLKHLENHLSSVSIPESMLKLFELLEEIHIAEGSPVTDAMSAAYCAIAVECTLKFLQLNVAAYQNAVSRIWRRVRYMEPSHTGEGSLLFSAELKRWKDDIEASLTDSQLRDNLAAIDTRRDAVHKLKAYLSEAWSNIGPSFLELLAAYRDFEVQRGVSQVEQRDEEVPRDHVSDSVTPELATEDPIPELPVEHSNANAADPAQGIDIAETGTAAHRRLPSYMERNTTATTSEEPPIEHLNTNVDTPDPAQRMDANEAGISARRSRRLSLMERNSTACTSEWDDFVDGSPGRSRSRIRLPSPKRKKHSPLKLYEPAKITKRRKNTKWSELEVDTLMDAVKKIGVGNWIRILDCHREVFEGRTHGDLKDKWRNLTRYPSKAK